MGDSLSRTLFRNFTGNLYSGQNLSHIARVSREAGNTFFISSYARGGDGGNGASTIRKRDKNEYWWIISFFCHHTLVILKWKMVGYLVEMPYQSTDRSF